MPTGYIYVISSPSTDKIYIGSTTNNLNHRLAVHKNDRDCTSENIIKYGDAVINMIEEVEYNNENELKWIERE